MSTPAHSPHSPGAAGAREPSEREPVSAELQFLLIAIAFVLVMLLAGVPGHENEAGDGSPSLRRGWAERHTAEVAAQETGGAPATPEAQGPSSADGR
ncbi:MAG TPA: hypothetical protein VK824_11665 [Planctomycetota bacterium]|nr:hypothetical protein [Planctomycetota bacterium]